MASQAATCWPLRRLARSLRCEQDPAPTEAGNRIRRETVVDLASLTDQTAVDRKTAIGGGLAALAALALPGQVRAQAKTQPDESFVLLLKGLYQPVTHGPNLGLSRVDLNDGS